MDNYLYKSTRTIKDGKSYNEMLRKMADELSINDILDMLDMKVDNNKSLESISTLPDGQNRHIIVTPYKYETKEGEE